ncbi:MAG TPA: fumarylacetoacetate hydrolase family protein [Solirubrobacter sp.]|nr:fumarylacetoacetate hydrolase family protein [Solirubrobacter sp.]
MSGFGIDNLPYGVAGGRCVVRYGDALLGLARLHPTLATGTLNPFLAAGRAVWEQVRAEVTRLLEAGTVDLEPLEEPELPVAIGDFVDFYASLEHASNLGRLFRPGDEPLLPNWRHLPIGYHGRAGSVVVSGTPVARPLGQRPDFGPTRELDIELELGFVTGGRAASRIPPAAVRDHVFGFVLVNDWSARDIQRWEYRPLGPFLGKSFATSISPWIVPLAALDPYLVAAREQDPEPLPYLRTQGDWALDAELEVELNGEVISQTNARGLYWTFPQLLAHATVNGAAARPGDLFASGTISGPSPGTEGSLIELGRSFLADGDTVVLRGRAGSVSFGEVRGTVVSAG